MRKTFQKWLFIFVSAAFLLTLAVSFSIQTRQAEKNALELIRLKLGDAKKQLQEGRENLHTIRDLTNSAALAKARALALLLRGNPQILKDSALLESFLKSLDIDEINISDETGRLIASTVPRFLNYEMGSAAQSAAFMPAITDKNFEFVQEPSPRGIDKTLYQYAGVARLDAPGIVQIGYIPERLQKAIEVANIEKYSPSLRVGNQGSIFLVKDGKIVGTDMEECFGKPLETLRLSTPQPQAGVPFSAKIGGQKYIGIAENFEGYLLLGLLPSNEIYLSRNAMLVFLIGGNFILFLVVFGLVSWLVQKVVISGIYRVNDSLRRITQGDLNEQVQVRTNAEFASLSNGINTTVDALKKAIAAEAKRLDAELEFARAIQLSSLPDASEAKNRRPEFEVSAAMFTAKEVGGDFYDFFSLGENRFAFVIADVSGKGIPAALFMMTAKTLLQDLCKEGFSPEKAFEQANRRLCQKNERGMFVTAFMGVLDCETGRFSYVNAGHNPPLLARKGQPYAYLRGKPDFVLAGLEESCYRLQEIQLQAGEKIFLYTDGAIEAVDPQGAFFGEERLLQALRDLEAKGLSGQALLSALKKEIDAFARGAAQADDITLMSVFYKGTR